MSGSMNFNELQNKSTTDLNSAVQNDEGSLNTTPTAENCKYTVTTSVKPNSRKEGQNLGSEQKSFISIHSTDLPCVVSEDAAGPTACEFNLEILSLKEAFQSTSEESLSNDSPLQKKKNDNKLAPNKNDSPTTLRSPYAPGNSKSATVRQRKQIESHPGGYSDIDIPKSTLYVIGSNPGEPKMSYPDPPKKMSKTMKKFLRNLDKQKVDQGNSKQEKAISKLTTVRGILKDHRCVPECTGDSVQGNEQFCAEFFTLPFNMDFGQSNYEKHISDKNVTFNTQVVIIHFCGDLCVGQSVEALSKETDQQARNSELRKTFLTKYNEFWPTQHK